MEYLNYASLLLPIIAIIGTFYLGIIDDRNKRSNINYINLKYNLIEFAKEFNDHGVLGKMIVESATVEALIEIYNSFCVNTNNQYAKNAKKHIETYSNLNDDVLLQRRIFLSPIFLIVISIIAVLWAPELKGNQYLSSIIGLGKIFITLVVAFSILCGYVLANYSYAGPFRNLLKRLFIISDSQNSDNPKK